MLNGWTVQVPDRPGANRRRGKMKKNTICLWYDTDAEEAARFYART
jgi:hypothetical protein